MAKYAVWALVGLCVAALAGVWYLFPLRHVGLIEEKAAAYGVDAALVCAVINAESRFRETAESHKGAMGLTQLTRGTAEWGASTLGLDMADFPSPAFDVEVGCWYLATLLKQFGGEREALAAYNAGSGRVAEWLRNPLYSKDGARLDEAPYPETSAYIARVELNLRVYRHMLALRRWAGRLFGG